MAFEKYGVSSFDEVVQIMEREGCTEEEAREKLAALKEEEGMEK